MMEAVGGMVGDWWDKQQQQHYNNITTATTSPTNKCTYNNNTHLDKTGVICLSRRCGDMTASKRAEVQLMNSEHN